MSTSTMSCNKIEPLPSPKRLGLNDPRLYYRELKLESLIQHFEHLRNQCEQNFGLETFRNSKHLLQLTNDTRSLQQLVNLLDYERSEHNRLIEKTRYVQLENISTNLRAKVDCFHLICYAKYQHKYNFMAPTVKNKFDFKPSADAEVPVITVSLRLSGPNRGRKVARSDKEIEGALPQESIINSEEEAESAASTSGHSSTSSIHGSVYAVPILERRDRFPTTIVTNCHSSPFKSASNLCGHSHPAQTTDDASSATPIYYPMLKYDYDPAATYRAQTIFHPNDKKPLQLAKVEVTFSTTAKPRLYPYSCNTY